MYSAVLPEYGASPQPQRLDEASGTRPTPDFNVQDLDAAGAERRLQKLKRSCRRHGADTVVARQEPYLILAKIAGVKVEW